MENSSKLQSKLWKTKKKKKIDEQEQIIEYLQIIINPKI